MDIFQAIILGVVEGISEFLPISSTGHLILASNLMSIPQTEFVKSFEIAIQSGAILSVVFLYWKKMVSDVELGKRVIVAFIPTAIVGFTLYSFIKEFLIGNVYVVLIALLAGGIALILIEIVMKREVNPKETTSFKMPSYKQSLGIGIFQSVAIIPGVSRSASSIIGGMVLGTNRDTAVEFSFLLAVPTLLAATVLDLGSTGFNFNGEQWTLLGVGFITSFIVAIFAIKWFIKFVATNTFIPFGVYRIGLAVLYFLLIVR